MQDALTPMMQQYQRLRKSIPADTLLLFRLGDFYEMFFDDAKEASALLNVALTKSNGVPMCGVPYHRGAKVHSPIDQGRTACRRFAIRRASRSAAAKSSPATSRRSSARAR